MTSYSPPIENVAIFDTTLFSAPGEATLTQNQADKRYLRFPNAQGTENLQTINVNGPANFNSTSIFSKRPYQQIGTDPSYSAVNGYYGLAEDAYPALNPYSSGVKAVSTWTTRSVPNANQYRTIVWAAELSLFVAVCSTGGSRILTSPDGINWTERSAGVNRQWFALAWAPELNLFVSLAQSGTTDRLTTSTDGINWTGGSTPVGADNPWTSVCWSPQLRLFVAVASNGTGNRVMTSSNGINWATQNTTGKDNPWTSVCWSPELKLFVAVGYTTALNGVLTSPDGINWDLRTTINANWNSVCWSPELGLFVATSISHTMTSTDGFNWTSQVALGGGLNFWISVCWVAELGLFVAVASTGTDRVMYSPDGVNWTLRTPPVSSWASICWAPELGIFASIANAGPPSVMTSSLAARPPTSYNVFDSSFNNIDANGQWSLQAKNLSTTELRITSADRIYQQLGTPDASYANVNGYYGLAKDAYPALNPYSSGVLATSTWTLRTTNTNTWSSVTWSPELRLFAAVASNGSVTNGAMTSPDGITWTPRTTNTNQWRRVIWAKELGLFVATAIGPTATNKVMYSTDGSTWIATSNGVLDQEWFGLTWSPELRLLVAVSRTGGTQRVMTSTDAINWTARTSPTTSQWINVCWAAELGLFVVAGITGIMTSPDGINWTVQSLSAPNSSRSWVNIDWSSTLGLFVAVAQDTANNVIMTSPDGINWTNRTSPTSIALYDVVWAAELELFVTIGNTGTILTSPDGITWTQRTSPAANQWFGITWAPELGIFAAVSVTGGTDRAMTSSLRGRPPTSYNVFDSDFNRIDQDGTWNFAKMNIANNLGVAPTLAVRDTTSNQGAILLLPNVPLANYNPGVKTNDKVIVTQSAGGASARPLFLTINDGPNTGVRIASNLVTLGAGGTVGGADPLTRITTNGATSTIDIKGQTINLDAATVDFQNTSTTTSTANHNADIKATSTGLQTTKFLKVKLNGADIWIPYFQTDPSL